jgi:hypothetical protein
MTIETGMGDIGASQWPPGTVKLELGMFRMPSILWRRPVLTARSTCGER